MEKRLSELFWDLKMDLMDDRGKEIFYMRQEDVKIYGEIVSLETSYNHGFWGYTRPLLQKIAQEHGIKDYKL